MTTLEKEITTRQRRVMGKITTRTIKLEKLDEQRRALESEIDALRENLLDVVADVTAEFAEPVELDDLPEFCADCGEYDNFAVETVQTQAGPISYRQCLRCGGCDQ